MALWQQVRRLPASVWLLGAVSFLNDSASEWVYPLLPLYLSSVLMAGPQIMGMIEGIAEATSSLLKLFSGVWVDRSGRAKPWVVSGYGMAAATRPLLAFVVAWPWLLLLRFLDRVGKGLRGAPRDVIIATSVDADKKGLAFGVHRSCDHAGAMVGPLIASVLLSLGLGLREVILWSAIPSVLAIVCSLLVREPQRITQSAKKIDTDWQWRALPKPFKRYLLALALFTLGNASNLFLLLQASELGLSQSQVPLVWAVVALVATLLSTPLSAWSDRIGRRHLLIWGWLAYSGFYLALGWLPGDWNVLLWPLFAAYGVFIAATEGVEKALVSDLVPKAMLGRAFGWFHLIAGLLLLPASLLFGWLWHAIGAHWAFSLAAVMSALGVVLVWRGFGEEETTAAAT